MDYFIASSTATATATVIPTIGLLPNPNRYSESFRNNLYYYIKPFILLNNPNGDLFIVLFRSLPILFIYRFNVHTM